MTDPIPELADDDLETLMDALEAWESKDLAGDIMGEVLEHMVMPAHGLPYEAEVQRRHDKAERAAAARLRKERSVMLRAKLLQIRDRRNAERMAGEILNRTG